MADQANYLEFIEAFNKIHKYLLKFTDSDDNVSFSDLLYRSKKHPMLSLYLDDLHVFRKLRNIIVHQTDDFDKIIAMPSEETVKRIRFIESQLIDPLKVDVFKGEVHHFQLQDGIQDVLSKSSDKGILKFPVYDGQKFVGLITSRAVAKWLQKEAKSGKITIDEKMQELLPYEKEDKYQFIGLNTTIYEAWELFKSETIAIAALLVTASGAPSEKIEAIITHEDLIQYLYTHNLYVFH
ncbi:MAG: hypothetical protein FWF59_04635 [Turicibacter sp.]|nr:hypothetical protein [Turicibacter sp.]